MKAQWNSKFNENAARGSHKAEQFRDYVHGKYDQHAPKVVDKVNTVATHGVAVTATAVGFVTGFAKGLFGKKDAPKQLKHIN